MEGTCITGGKCKVAWKRALRPTKLGGLGILDLQRFSRALRIRWVWLAWTSDNKPWFGMEVPCTKSDCRLFNAATKITIGNGAKASFWHSSGWNGECPKDVHPLIFQISSRKNRTVQQALTENNWVRDINLLRFDTVQHFIQFTRLWQGLQEVELNPETQDQITWKLTASGEYTARSVYLAQFIGAVNTDFDRLI